MLKDQLITLVFLFNILALFLYLLYICLLYLKTIHLELINPLIKQVVSHFKTFLLCVQTFFCNFRNEYTPVRYTLLEVVFLLKLFFSLFDNSLKVTVGTSKLIFTVSTIIKKFDYLFYIIPILNL